MQIVQVLKPLSLLASLCGLNPTLNNTKSYWDKLLVLYHILPMVIFTYFAGQYDLFANTEFSNSKIVIFIEGTSILLFYINILCVLRYSKKMKITINKMIALDKFLNKIDIYTPHKEDKFVIYIFAVITIIINMYHFIIDFVLSADDNILRWNITNIPIMLNNIKMMYHSAILILLNKRLKYLNKYLVKLLEKKYQPGFTEKFNGYAKAFSEYIKLSKDLLIYMQIPLLMTLFIHFMKLINEMYIISKVELHTLDNYQLISKMLFNMFVISTIFFPFYLMEIQVNKLISLYLS